MARLQADRAALTTVAAAAAQHPSAPTGKSDAPLPTAVA